MPLNSEEREIQPVSCLYMHFAYSEPTGSPVPALTRCQISTKGSCLLAEFTAATGCQFRPGSHPEISEHKQNEHATTCKIPEALRQKQARFRVKSGAPGTPPQLPRGQFLSALEHPAECGEPQWSGGSKLPNVIGHRKKKKKRKKDKVMFAKASFISHLTQNTIRTARVSNTQLDTSRCHMKHPESSLSLSLLSQELNLLDSLSLLSQNFTERLEYFPNLSTRCSFAHRRRCY